MAKKGDTARKNLVDMMAKFFTDNGMYAGTQDKKLYVNVPDGAFGSEVVQFAISLTMPKTPVVVTATPKEDAPQPLAATTISAEDKAKVQELLKKLDIDEEF